MYFTFQDDSIRCGGRHDDAFMMRNDLIFRLLFLPTRGEIETWDNGNWNIYRNVHLKVHAGPNERHYVLSPTTIPSTLWYSQTECKFKAFPHTDIGFPNLKAGEI